MHPAFSTRGAQRRRLVSNSVRTREPTCIVQLPVDADALGSLREVVVRIGGAAFEYMRVAPGQQAGKVTVWVCLRPARLDMVALAVRRDVPGAAVGQILHQSMQAPRPPATSPCRVEPSSPFDLFYPPTRKPAS